MHLELEVFRGSAASGLCLVFGMPDGFNTLSLAVKMMAT